MVDQFRGPVLIHAGVKEDDDFDCRDFDGVLPADGDYPWQGDAVAECGGIVGIADIVDCVSEHASPWFFGRFGFVLANARPLPFIPVKGALGFFDWQSRIITPSAKAPPAPAQGRLF